MGAIPFLGQENWGYQRCPMSSEDAAAFDDSAFENQDIVIVWHGAPWYAAGNIMKNSFLGFNDKELGHRILEDKPGAYVTPRKNFAPGYATAQLLFHDESLPPERQRWCKCIFECRTNINRRIGKKAGKNDNVQWVFPEAALRVVAFHVATNCPPGDGEGRYAFWKPELEARPPGVLFSQIRKINSKVVEDTPVEAVESVDIPSSSEKKHMKCLRCGEGLMKYSDSA